MDEQHHQRLDRQLAELYQLAGGSQRGQEQQVEQRGAADR